MKLQEEFSVEVTLLGSEALVALRGELDMGSARELRSHLNRVLSIGPDTLLLDVSKLAFCDSSGLAVFAEYHRRAQRDGFKFVIDSPSRELRSLFALTEQGALLQTGTRASSAASAGPS
jgi:anti-sigma B factor antagonist